MMHVIEQTRDEKIAMYLKLPKRELAEMLVNVNDSLGSVLRAGTSAEQAREAEWVRFRPGEIIVWT